MPYKYVEPELAFRIKGLEIYHMYQNDDIKKTAKDVYEFNGYLVQVERYLPYVDDTLISHRELIEIAIEKELIPFHELPSKKFRVERLVDAYQVYYQDIEAKTEEEALSLAWDTDEGWTQGEVREFDDVDHQIAEFD